MKCTCVDCKCQFEYDYKVSMCDDCLLTYNGKEFDVFCNKCKTKIKTVLRPYTENNFIDVLQNCLKKYDLCNDCGAVV